MLRQNKLEFTSCSSPLEASSRGDASGEKNLVLMQRVLDEAIQRQTERVWTTNTVPRENGPHSI